MSLKERFIYQNIDVKIVYQFKSVFNPIQRLWNKFQMNIFEYKFYFIFNLTIQSNNLGVFRLNNKRSLRLELMNHLNNIGYSNREITDFLNVSNIIKV